MKAAVLKTFKDKHTGAVYAPGEVLTLERKRFGEIRETLGDSYIAEIVDPAATLDPEKPNNDGTLGAVGDPPAASASPEWPVLAGLAIGSLSLTPDFDPHITSYTAATSNNTNKVRAVPADDSALILVSINGEAVPNESSVAWNDGENALAVSVAVDGGGHTDYIVTVTKK